MLIACRGEPVLVNLFVAGLHTSVGVLAGRSEFLYLFGMALMFVPVLGFGASILWLRLKKSRGTTMALG